MIGRSSSGAVAGLALLVAVPAQAAIEPRMVCVNGVVDKEKLAVFALTKAGVSFFPIYWAERHGEPFAQLPPAVRILAMPDFCKGAEGDGSDVAFPKCQKGDDAKIVAASTYFDDLLGDHGYSNPQGVTKAQWLRSPNARILCTAGAEAAAEWVVAPAFPKVSRCSGVEFPQYAMDPMVDLVSVAQQRWRTPWPTP